MRKRILSLILSLCMVAAMLPMGAITASAAVSDTGSFSDYTYNNDTTTSQQLMMGSLGIIQVNADPAAATQYAASVTQNGATTGYDTFAEAWAATGTATDESNRATVQLLGDVTNSNHASWPIQVYGRSITIDLNGYDIDRGQTTPIYNGGVFDISNGNLTIQDSSSTDVTNQGKITGGNTNGSAGCIQIMSSTLTMSGGNITGNKAKLDGGAILVNIGGGFTMSGGSITNNESGAAGGGVEVSSYENGFTMTGGSITGNKANFGGGVAAYGSFKVSGAVNITQNFRTTSENADNVSLPPSSIITVIGPLNGASIGVNMGYDRLGDGVFTSGYNASNAGVDPSTVFIPDSTTKKVQKNVDDQAELVVNSTPTYSLTVNLDRGNGSTTNGNYIGGAQVVINAGTKTGYTFSGWITSNGGVFADSSLTNTTFTMPEEATSITATWMIIPTIRMFNISDGNIIVEDGTTPGKIKVTYAAGMIEDNIDPGDMLTIIQTNASTTNTITVNTSSDRTLNITLSGVKIDTSAQNDKCAFDIQDNSVVNLTLTNSNTLYSGNNKAGLQVQTKDGKTATVTIEGQGELHARAGGGAVNKGSAGIGGGDDSAGGTIIINSGAITATGSSFAGAGIGGGNNGSGGTITIKGGTVTAIGGVQGAAGIGGGLFGAAGTITISGGIVNATGYERFGFAGGTGLGHGAFSTALGDIITISGGTVTAAGGRTSPGIQANGTIKIDNAATVIAVSTAASVDKNAIVDTDGIIEASADGKTAANILMVKYADEVTANTATTVKNGENVVATFAPASSYKSIAFTVPTGNYTLFKGTVQQTHGESEDKIFGVSAVGVNNFSNVKDDSSTPPATTITKNITIGTAAPVKEATIANGTNTSPMGVAGPVVTWSADGGANYTAASGNFAAGTVYKTKYVYTASTGHVFDSEVVESDITVTNLGSGTKTVTLSGSNQTLTITVTWPATGVANDNGAATLLVDSSAANDSASRANLAKYKTIWGALNKAVSGDTIKMQAGLVFDDTGEYSCLQISDKNIILDLNGHTISSASENALIVLKGIGSIEVTDSSPEESGRMSGASRVILNFGTGSVTVSGGTLSATGLSTIQNQSTGTVTITGGTLSTTGNTSSVVYSTGTGSVIVSGGTLSATTGATINSSGGSVTVSGGTLSSTENHAISSMEHTNATITVSGGTLSAGWLAIFNGKATISGGTFEAVPGSVRSDAGYVSVRELNLSGDPTLTAELLRLPLQKFRITGLLTGADGSITLDGTGLENIPWYKEVATADNEAYADVSKFKLIKLEGKTLKKNGANIEVSGSQLPPPGPTCNATLTRPTFAIADQTIAVGQPSRTITMTASGSKIVGDCLTGTISYTYKITSGGNAAGAVISGNQLTIAPTSPGTYNITVEATASLGGKTSTRIAAFTVTKAAPPAAETTCIIENLTFIVPTLTIPKGQDSTIHTLTASATLAQCTGADNGEIVYVFSTKNNSAGALIDGNSLTVTRKGSVTISVTASHEGATATKEVTINVINTDVNEVEKAIDQLPSKEDFDYKTEEEKDKLASDKEVDINKANDQFNDLNNDKKDQVDTDKRQHLDNLVDRLGKIKALINTGKAKAADINAWGLTTAIDVRADILAGSNVTIQMDIEDEDNSSTPEATKADGDIIRMVAHSQQKETRAAFSINLKKIIEEAIAGETKVTTQVITETQAPIYITITVPVNMRGGSEYEIMHVHTNAQGGKEVEIIVPVYDESKHTLTFAMSRFSTIAIIYKPKMADSGNQPSGGGGSTPTLPPKTEKKPELEVPETKQGDYIIVIPVKDGAQEITPIELDKEKIKEIFDKDSNKKDIIIQVDSNKNNDNNKQQGTQISIPADIVDIVNQRGGAISVITDAIEWEISSSQLKDIINNSRHQQLGVTQGIEVIVTAKVTDQGRTNRITQDATRQKAEVVSKLFDFTVATSYNQMSYASNSLFGYTTIRIPVPLGSEKYTTAVRFDDKGNMYHIPTYFKWINGRLYAEIKSVTSGTYGIVNTPRVFDDIRGHWSEKAVTNMASRLIVAGVGDNLYEPDRNITRAEFVTLLIKSLGLSGTLNVATAEFSDVTSDKWYYEAVQIARAQGFISGYGNNAFKPQETINRQEAMIMLAKAAHFVGLAGNSQGTAILNNYIDQSEVALWAKDDVASVVGLEIFSGFGNGTLKPKESISRSQSAQALSNLLTISQLINR